MHIPGHMLTDPVCTTTAVAASAALGWGVYRVRSQSPALCGPLMAATGAGIFAAQMVNFPIDQGTSGHLVGATLAAIVLGPWAGMLAMAVVILTQCLVFGDGGVDALGANLLNMAVVATLVGSGVYQVLHRALPGRIGNLAAAAVAAWASVMAASTLCSLELAASGHGPLAVTLAAMNSVHSVIGAGESLITTAVLGLILATAPGLLSEQRPLVLAEARSVRRLTIGSLVLAALVALLLAPFASSAPDGLERVAQTLGFANLAGSGPGWSLMPDYMAPGVTWPLVAIALAGILGVATVYVASYAVGRGAMCRVPKGPRYGR